MYWLLSLALVFILVISSIFKITTWSLEGGIITVVICLAIAWFIFKALFVLTKWLIILGIAYYIFAKIKQIKTN